MKRKSINKSTRKNKTPVIIFLFIFVAIIHLYAASIQCVWTGIERIIAVGDIHGDYKNFIKILKGVSLVDEELHWKGGKAHFVQTGDIMDRGPEAKKAFDLLMRLEKEAEEADGKVHFLVGNHEEVNITGIAFDYAGFITVEQFVSFLPDKYRKNKEKEFRKKLREKDTGQSGQDLLLDNNLRPYWEELMKNNMEARKLYTHNFNEKYGKWIINHNAVIKINDVIFTHGGISKSFSTWKLKDINNLLRDELNYARLATKGFQPFDSAFKPRIVYKSEGPLWYRELALLDEEGFQEEVEKILNNLGAKYMVIAHTPRMGSRIISRNYMSRFQERIWVIDTGISEHYGGFLSALIIENGKFSLWGETDEY